MSGRPILGEVRLKNESENEIARFPRTDGAFPPTLGQPIWGATWRPPATRRAA